MTTPRPAEIRTVKALYSRWLAARRRTAIAAKKVAVAERRKAS